MQERKEELEALIKSMRFAWDPILAEIQKRIDSCTSCLVSVESQEMRGRIKALTDLIELPAQLQNELDGINAELP
jgi:hypothetical protein